MVKHFDSQNFENGVLNNKNFVLVDFFATWCGPCQMLSPVIDEISEDPELNLTVGKVDIDKCQDIAQNFGIQSIPTIILFKAGQEAKRIMGFVPKENLKEQILDCINQQNI